MKASDMYYRVFFDAPSEAPDGYGGVEIGWDTDNAVEAYANFRFLRGGEAVQAARLSGKQPAVVTIHNFADARQITSDWRMRDARSGKVYQVRTDPIMTDDRRFLEVTVESGVAV